MAIFGDLADFPFIELIAMLEKRHGVLFLENIGRYTKLELHLGNDRLKRIVVGEVAIYDLFSATNLLLEIVHDRQGKFEFQGLTTQSETQSPLNIKLQDFLMRLTVLADEWQAHLTDLPDIDTRFVAGTRDLVWLEGELQTFWTRIEPLLNQGVTARALMLRFDLDPRWTQLNLYKLRATGLIRPLRRIEDTAYYRQRYASETKTPETNSIAEGVGLSDVPLEPQLSTIKTPATELASPSLLSKLLGALRLRRNSV